MSKDLKTLRQGHHPGLVWSSLATVVLAYGYFWLCHREAFNGLLADSWVSLAAAKSLVAGPRLESAFLLHIARHWPLPPFYAVLLALTGTIDPGRIWLLNATLMAGAVLLSGVVARAFGLRASVAVLIALTFATLPQTLLSVLNLLSEVPYLVFTLGAVAMAVQADRAPRCWWVVAVLCGLAAITRTVGVAAVLAFLVAWGARGATARRPWVALPALLPPLLWWGIGQSAGFAQYSGAGDPLPLLARLQANGAAFAYSALVGIDPLEPTSVQWLVVLLVALAVPAWWRRLRALQFDACYCLFYGGVMAFWPHTAHAPRFLFPLWPLLLCYACLPLAWLAGSLHKTSVQRLLAGVLPVLMLMGGLPAAWLLVTTIAKEDGGPFAVAVRGPAWHLHAEAEARQGAVFEARLETLLASLRQTPRDTCVATVVPEQVLFFGERRSVNVQDTVGRPAALDTVLAACPLVLMVDARPFPRVEGLEARYPEDVLQGRLQPLLEAPGVALLAAVKKPAR